MTIIRPPFTSESAAAKVRAAEDAWNSRDPQRVSMAYSEDSEWRNRDRFLRGRDQIREFLSGKWHKRFSQKQVASVIEHLQQRIRTLEAELRSRPT